MAKSHANASWYIADLIEEIRVAGRRRNHVWVNTVLIQAKSSDDAYKKALKTGTDGNHSYKNVYGEKVNCKFRGLRELIKVQYPLRHGCELFYRSRLLFEPGIKRLMRKKNNLTAFCNADASSYQD